MTLTCKNVEAIIYGYDRQTGDTGKNLVADMLKEMANAIGFNITLLKEDCNPNKAFCFQEEDVEIIRKIIMLSKSKEGKRLRCRDYEGAGFLCVVGAINAYKLLALHAGISKTQVNLELRKMHECTNQFVLRELIRFETNDYDIDLTEHFLHLIAIARMTITWRKLTNKCFWNLFYKTLLKDLQIFEEYIGSLFKKKNRLSVFY